MARKLRVEFAGACCHVLIRGNYRIDLFAPAWADGFHFCQSGAVETRAFKVVLSRFPI